ncbi:hypothetical protein B0H21DRAFT_408732 [Amylocystis lapponica]|nr:hypothetical protein B0H21DRAFT_408732 [Amylocystis lapponica]
MATVTPNGVQLFFNVFHERPSLESLPNEVLLEIFDHVYPSKNMPKCFTVPCTLSKVCRRFRALALSLLVREVVVRDSAAYIQALKYFGEGPGKARAHFVRSVRIERNDDTSVDCDNRYEDDNSYPFHNLRSFTCLEGVCSPPQLKSLEKCRQLSSLTLVWRYSRFPDLSAWVKLRTIRLFLEWTLLAAYPPKQTLVVSSLTTLSVHGAEQSRRFSESICDMSFPNLRVLSLHETRAHVSAVYSFVQQHPSLREVNVSFWQYVRLSFDSLVKLIDGSGTWRRRTDTHAAVDPPKFHFDTSNDRETYMTFNAFGFARLPLVDPPAPPHGPTESAVQRYKVTALAIPVFNQRCWEHLGAEPLMLPDLFKMADRFPAMEELRIASGTTQYEGTFISFMGEIGENLRDWKCLRKLSLSWVIPTYWMWGPAELELGPMPDSYVPILDAVRPPVYAPEDDDADEALNPNDPASFMSGPSHGPTLCVTDFPRLFYEKYARMITDNLHRSLGPDVDVDAHAEDRNFLMQQWEARHYPLVARMMRRLGERCPTLEEVEWVPTGACHPLQSVRWVWKFHRGKTLGVTGDLTYGSGLRGSVPYLPNLVGQELASMRDFHASTSRSFQFSRLVG